jgi:peptidyl-tRNA hydrolase, PTH1 family
MKLIVGLGNPGEKYESTRHNVGFMVVDHLLKDLEPVSKSNWDRQEKLKSDIYVFEYDPRGSEPEKVILAKPLTYMNNSGMAVSLIANFYKVNPEDIWIVNDELDLPFGSMKIRFGGASAGHHGVDSIIESLGTDKFWRFRMGIGMARDHSEMAKHQVNGQEYVLKNFHGAEKSKARALVKRGAKSLSVALEKGIESAMNQFNTK